MIIDNEFKSLIPPLTPEEYKQLEENILEDGIRDSLIVWHYKGDWILIDGHNRYEIAKKHNLPYNQMRMEFPDREAVKEWIIRNQFGRRNLSAYDRSLLALKLKPMIAEKAKEKQGERTDICQKSDRSSIDTKKELAKVAGVSHDTIHKVEVIQEKASPEAKEALKRGDLSINSVYSGIVAMEKETKKQKERRELKEAEKRHEEFQNSENQIVDFSKVTQEKQDKRRIFSDLYERYSKFYKAVLDFDVEIGLGNFRGMLDYAESEEVEEIERKFQTITEIIQRAREEIKNVKK